MCSLVQAQINSPMLCALSNSSHDTQQCLGGAASGGTSLLWWYPAISEAETGRSMDEQPRHILIHEDMKDCRVLPHWTVFHYRTSSWWPPPHWCVCHGPEVERYETRGGKLEGLLGYFLQNIYIFFLILCNTLLLSSFTCVFVNHFIPEFLLSHFIKQAYSSTTCMSDLDLHHNFTFYPIS